MVNCNTVICALKRIEIGNDCLVGDAVAIFDSDFHELNPSRRRLGSGPVMPVVIGNNVWIGSRSIILKGVSLGDNSVIGAMSVVTKPVPPNTLVAGNPARVVRSLG